MAVDTDRAENSCSRSRADRDGDDNPSASVQSIARNAGFVQHHRSDRGTRRFVERTGATVQHHRRETERTQPANELAENSDWAESYRAGDDGRRLMLIVERLATSRERLSGSIASWCFSSAA